MKLPLGQAAGVWKERHAVAGHVTGPGSRCRTLLLLGGLVLPLWSILERILDRQTRVADRKLAIIRLQLTGESHPRRLGTRRASCPVCVCIHGCQRVCIFGRGDWSAVCRRVLVASNAVGYLGHRVGMLL